MALNWGIKRLRPQSLLLLFVFTVIASPQAPSILSRGGAEMRGDRAKSLFTIQPFASISGSYEDGITPPGLDANGKPLDESSLGASLSVGLVGSKSWRHSSLGVSLAGGYPIYTGANNDFGENRFRYSLAANHSYEKSTGGRSGLVFQQALGMGDGAFSLSNFAGVGGIAQMVASNSTDPAFKGAPIEEIYQSKNFFGSSAASYIWQKSNRLSFRATGSAATTYRRHGGLASSYSASAGGDISYALDRNQTIGIDYAYSHIGFNHSFGATDAHSVGLSYSRRIGRNWNFGGNAGTYRAESERIASVQLDPYIASILGTSTSMVAAHNISHGFMGALSLSRSFRLSSLSFSASQGISPGNGVFLASKATNGTFSYSYAGIRKWSIGSSLTYTRFSALLQNTKPYQGYTGIVSTGRQIYGVLGSFFSAGLRRYDTGVNQRSSYFVSAGLSISPHGVRVPGW